ncbi:hypothetical protein C0J52_20573 [Blattella germanica]|nr:hypothetical protein C0J52_20573 [Blattella germanica]
MLTGFLQPQLDQLDSLRIAVVSYRLRGITYNEERTCGHVNRYNCRIWADDQPNALQEWERDSTKVNVWMGITKSKMYGPYMFAERTVTGRYNIP